MNDITKRLREFGPHSLKWALLQEAATEIERQRQRVKDEREACASIADEIAAVNDERAPKDYRDGWSCAAFIVARNIRERNASAGSNSPTS